MKAISLIVAMLALTQTVSPFEEEYSIERDNSPMAHLARDHMPHIKTLEQLRNMEYKLKANMNDYVDRMMGKLKTYILEHDLDPLKLPDYIRTFSHKFLWINWHGGLVVNNGKFSGASTIYRNGDVILNYDKDVLTLDAALGFIVMEVSYDYSITFMGIGPRGYLKGEAVETKIHIKLSGNLDTEKVHLDLFDIENIGVLAVQVSGLGIILDWLVDIVVDIVINIFKGPITEVIQAEVGKALANVVDNIHFGSFVPQ